MRKLWKHEWNYHLFFLVFMLFVLIVDFHHFVRGQMYYTYVDLIDMEPSQMIWEIIWTFGGMQYRFMQQLVSIVLMITLIKKAFIYYVENNVYGREFFQTLPIRKGERFWFHLLMDAVTVAVAVAVMGIYEPLIIQNRLLLEGVEIPWLSASYVGMMVVNICYILMLLGLLYIVESIFVNGPMKLVGFCGALVSISYILDYILEKYEANPIVQAVYGFISRESVAGNYYGAVSASSNYEILGEPGKNIYYIWMHKHSNPPFMVQGEQVNYSDLTKNYGELAETMTSINQCYNFTNASSYIWHAIGYLVIGILLIIVASKLIKQQDVSKEGFYFEFGKYVVSGFLSITFYVVLMINKVSGWHQVVCMGATLIVFLLLVCLLDVNKSKAILHRIRDFQKS